MYNVTHLYIKSCLLEIFHQWKTASNGVWLALTHHLLCSFIKLFEGIRVQVAGYTLVCVDVCTCVGGGSGKFIFTVALVLDESVVGIHLLTLIKDANNSLHVRE